MKSIASLIAIISVAMLEACSPGEQAATTAAPPSLPVTTVSSANAETYNEYPATVEGQSEVEIRPQVGGILEKIFVDEGAHVTAGEPLFKINDQVYNEQLNNASAELLAAKAAADNAQLEVDKLTPLVQNKVVAELQLKTAKSNYSLAAAKVKQAQAIVADAQINIGYTLIKAPASGYIGRLNKKAGSLLSINDSKELTTLSNIKDVRVYFSLSEEEFSTLKEELPGNTIEEKLKNARSVSLFLGGNNIYPEQGKLDMVNGNFDKNSGAITIRATFPNGNGLLRSGNTGKIRLSFTQNNVISIPQAATTTVQDKVFVYTIGDSSKVHKQMINISGRAGNDFLIKEGLKNGDRIVTEGIETLQDGMKIQPVPTKTNAVAQLNK